MHGASATRVATLQSPWASLIANKVLLCVLAKHISLMAYLQCATATLPLLGTLVRARQVHKMLKIKICSWAPLECIAGQKPLWAAISEIYETFSQIMSNEQFCTLPKCLPVRIQRRTSATHSSPSPSRVRAQPSLSPEDKPVPLCQIQMTPLLMSCGSLIPSFSCASSQ